MPDPDPDPDPNRITELEIALAHQQRLGEELSDLLRDHLDRLAQVERQVAVLRARLAALEAGDDAPPAPDVRPPHW